METLETRGCEEELGPRILQRKVSISFIPLGIPQSINYTLLARKDLRREPEVLES